MPFGLGDLKFIDDAIDSVMGGLDDLFSNKEERQKAENELRKLKNKLKEQTQDHIRDMRRMTLEDRQQARSVQQKSFNKAWWVMPAIALLSVVGFFGILLAFVFIDIPAGGQTPLSIMLGILGNIVGQVTQFYFGSSSGSKQKDDRFHDLTQRMSQSRSKSTSEDNGETKTTTHTERQISEAALKGDIRRVKPAGPKTW